VSVIRNEVRRGTYLDSVALMRISQRVAALPGVEEAGLMIGTPANKQILAEARVLDATGQSAEAGDLVIAVRGRDQAAVEAAVRAALQQIDAPRSGAGEAAVWQPRTLRRAADELADANLALISVPGDFAAAEAMKALGHGLNVMIFSDNVAIEAERELKLKARELGLMVMGPDCGTAIIAGTPIAFANVVPPGGIGIIGASGTGIQEVSTLVARIGRGVSHAIGTGGRDLKAEIGGITTLMAIDALDADPATEHIVVISKPPAEAVARRVIERIGKSAKPATICFIGGRPTELPANARFARTLKEAAELATGARLPATGIPAAGLAGPGKAIRGLYSGGTLCAEAQVVLLQAGLSASSNVPVPGAARLEGRPAGHALIDLGDDDFTRGRPHPMIEPAVRDAPLAEALADPAVGVVLIDVVLGFGGHADPAGHLAGALRRSAGSARRPLIVASITGTDGDPQRLDVQRRKLDGLALVATCNADAAAVAAHLVGAA
jgi:FdrA protein